MIFNLLNAVMAALFALSALVQWNDPDPLAWIAIYAACAVSCLLAFTQYRIWLIPAIICVLCLLWAISLLPGIYVESSTINWAEVIGSIDMKSMQSEIVREVGGLLIAATWMLVLAFKFRR